MAKPKIIFRDISSQHFSATESIYEEMKRQGFDCEVQLLKVPRSADLFAFAKKHEDDVCDLIITASLTRYVFAGRRKIHGVNQGVDYFKAVKGRGKSIFVSHGVGGEETPWGDYYEFKGVFLIGQFWMDLFTRFELKTYITECQHCGKIRIFTGENWKRPRRKDDRPKFWDWRCHTKLKTYLGTEFTDGEHCKIVDTQSGGFPNLSLIGMPKLDLLASPNRFNVAKKLSNEFDLPYDKTILYAPTLRRLDSFDDSMMRLLKLANDLKVNLLIKAHCDDVDEEHQPKSHLNAKKKAEEMKNIRWIDPTVPSITPYYLISDVIISANSGCLREFMLTDRPSIQLTNTSADLREKFFYEGCVQSSLDDLRKNIIRTIYVPETLQKERQEQVKLIFHKPDGHATKRAVETIKEIMGW